MLLRSFAGVVAQPFHLDLRSAVSAAATSIALAAGIERINAAIVPSHCNDLEVVYISLALVLVWMLVSAAATKPESRALTMARNLSVLSFWIAGTGVVVLMARLVAPPDSPSTISMYACLGLLVLIPIHLWRNLPIGRVLGMTAALWSSTGFLAWRIIECGC